MAGRKEPGPSGDPQVLNDRIKAATGATKQRLIRLRSRRHQKSLVKARKR